MSATNGGGLPWRGIAVAAAAMVLLGAVGLTFLGSQVSGILSTVGASVSGPYEGGYTDGGDQGENADGGTGSDGTNGDGTGGTGGGSGVTSGGGVVTAIPLDDMLVIKTGTMTLQVEAIAPALQTAAQKVSQIGGYASGSTRSGTGDSAQATVTYRVPAERWDTALDALRSLAIEVLGEDTKTEDVTTQVIDLGARIKNLQATEAAFQSIMDQAVVIKDILTVQAELTTVRGQIEQLTAQRAHLEEQAAFSTITVSFQLKAPLVLVEQQAAYDPATEVDAASALLVRYLQNAATAGIWFGIVWLPVLIAVAIAVAIGWFVARLVVRARRRFASTIEPSAPAGP